MTDQSAEETGLEVGIFTALGTVVGMAIGFLAGLLSHRLQLGFTVTGLAWFVALFFVTWWGSALPIVAGMPGVRWLTKEASHLLRSRVAIEPITVTLSLALPAALAVVLIVWAPDLVLPAAGVGYLIYFAIMLRGDMSNPPKPTAESPAARRDLFVYGLLGLGLGLLLGYFSRYGTQCCDSGANNPGGIMALGMFIVVAALAEAPIALAAMLRTGRTDGDAGIITVGASTLVGFGLAWAVIALLGHSST